MSPRAMRPYRSAVLRCAACGKQFHDRPGMPAEHRMVAGQIYHPVCAPRESPR